MRKCIIMLFSLMVVNVLIVSCATTPIIPGSYDKVFQEAVENKLGPKLAFDPYGNSVYLSDTATMSAIDELYYNYLNKIESEVPNAKSAYGGYLQYIRPNSKEIPAQTYVSRDSVVNEITVKYGIPRDYAIALSNDIYNHGWASIKYGHAVEDGDLAIYNVPMKFFYYRIWIGGVGPVITGEMRSFDFIFQSKKSKEEKPQNTIDIETKLKKLEDLHNKNLITDDEYKAKKSEILSAY